MMKQNSLTRPLLPKIEKILPAKNILLGVTGGIASYKSAELVRLLRKSGHEVQVVMTESAQEFVTPLLLATLSDNPAHSKLFDHKASSMMGHISLAKWAEMILIAPATANCIAKLAHGICDDLLSTLCLAKADGVQLVIAPAMNKQMWNAEATQHNLQILRNRGALIVGPVDGSQACGDVGLGCMLEPTEILKLLTERSLPRALQGCRIVITAGPTREHIDPVRYISNASSGKMGYALATSAAAAGATITLISGPTGLAKPNNVNIVDVVSTREMFEAVMSKIKSCDIFVSVAAVTDYCSEAIAEHKIKKSGCKLELALEQNPDILAAVAALPSPPITIGFAAETENVLANAAKKLKDKRVDMIVANKVGHGLGFGKDENHLFVFSKNQKQPIELGPDSKAALADQLIQIVAKAWIQTSSLSK